MLNEKNSAKVSGVMEKSPKMLENMNLTVKLSKKIKQKDLDKLYDILGISDKSKKPKRNSLLGIVNVFDYSKYSVCIFTCIIEILFV